MHRFTAILQPTPLGSAQTLRIPGRSRRRLGMALLVVACAASRQAPFAAEPPSITFASLVAEMSDLEALARYPQPEYEQRQASSYNRLSTRRDQAAQGTDGWFADSDGVSWIREEEIQGRRQWVVMEHDGPGCLTKFWTPFFYYDFNNRSGPELRIYLDGATEPILAEQFIELLTRNEWPASYGLAPEKKNRLSLPTPFAGFTARAGNLYLPIPFSKSCKVALSDKPFYHIVNYRTYPPGTAVATFSWDQYRAALPALEKASKELQSPTMPGGLSTHAIDVSSEPLAAGRQAALDLPPGPGAIRQLEIFLDPGQLQAQPEILRSTVVKLEFDGEETVWCPLGDFFASGHGLNAFKTWTREATPDGTLICRWAMPYRHSATLTLENLGSHPVRCRSVVHVGPWKWDARSMHFWTRWRGDDLVAGNRFVDWNFVDVRGQGVFVGDIWTVLNRTRGWWGEGDEKIYIDDAYDGAKFPNHFGTGTEDYYGWAGGVNPTRDDKFDSPLLANVRVGSTDEDNTRGVNVCLRIRSLDAIPFHTRLVFDMEASPGVDQRNPWDLLGYSAVSSFYALPGAVTNRPPVPHEASRPPISLTEIDRRAAALHKQSE